MGRLSEFEYFDFSIGNNTFLELCLKMTGIKDNLLEIIEGINVRFMPIYDVDLNIVSYELLSSKQGIDTRLLMSNIDSIEGGKTQLFFDVFSKAVSYLDENSSQKNITLSINIGPEELKSDELMDFLLKTRKKYIKYISLEILEYSFGVSSLEIYKNIEKLKNVGYSIIIDDFGSKSSDKKRVKMFYSHKFLDGIKLDGIFINRLKGLAERELEEYKVYFHSLRDNGIDITAEFIENSKTFDFAKSLGANKFQGKFFEKSDKNKK
ncbi:hypothetical protein CSA08_03050 [Candidatus Gracilibacteria bacterium]|nr:MAG: hypothetical protein CSA08_03050 [Candidatus Gracilibacteria bacterium]